MAIKTRTEFNGRIGVVEIKGSLVGDKETDQFRDAVTDFIEQGNKCLIVNMSKINYLNSSGLGALIRAHTSYKAHGGEIKLVGLNDKVQNLLIMTKLIDVFDVHDEMDQAIDSFVKTK